MNIYTETNFDVIRKLQQKADKKREHIHDKEIVLLHRNLKPELASKIREDIRQLQEEILLITTEIHQLKLKGE